MSKRKGREKLDPAFRLTEVEPLTHSQLLAFESNKHLVLYGTAGTGKTYISLYLAFDDMIKKHYDNIIILRSVVPTRDIGFLPGSEKEKISVYEVPYEDICNELWNRGDAYEILTQKHLVNFMSTSFIRGLTFTDSIILVDEIQNMTFHELDSIITRVGENCRVIFCGDYYQSDLKDNGLKKFLAILLEMDCFDSIEFGVNDIVRSKFVKNYLITKHKHESRSV